MSDGATCVHGYLDPQLQRNKNVLLAWKEY